MVWYILYHTALMTPATNNKMSARNIMPASIISLKLNVIHIIKTGIWISWRVRLFIIYFVKYHSIESQANYSKLYYLAI